MRNTRALCQTAVVAALYVALTTLNPLSWGAIQFRVANMLCALPFKDKRYAPELYAMVGAPFLLTAAGLFVGTFLAVELGNIMISKTALARIV